MAVRVFDTLNVVGFVTAAVGPIVCKTLADYGATAIRIESTQRPCILRTAQPFKDGQPGINRSGYFDMYNANLHSLALNIRMAQARPVLDRLVKWADVVVENYAPGAMARSGLGYDDVRKLNPGVIMISLSQQGQTGPHRAVPGYGAQLEGVSGILNLTGYPDQPPCLVCQSYPDFVAPPFAIAALVAALDYRRRTGKGQYIDCSEYEDTLLYLQPALMDCLVNGRIWNRDANKVSDAAPHAVYRCKGSDQWCAIAVYTDAQWTAFCQVIGTPQWSKEEEFATLASRKANEDELNRLVEEWTMQCEPRVVMDRMIARGVPAGAVQNSGDVFADPQHEARGYFQILDHPEIGPHPYARSNFTLSKTPGAPVMASPLLGEHTEHVCRDLLEMTEEEFDQGLLEGIFE